MLTDFTDIWFWWINQSKWWRIWEPLFIKNITNIYKYINIYNKYLTENKTKTYKKANKNKVNRMNSEAKRIAGKLKLDDIIQQLQETEAFISVNDHSFRFIKECSEKVV